MNTSPNSTPDWLFDNDSSHHITNDLNALALHTLYDGTDELVIGDGSSFTITRVGSLIAPFANTSFTLTDVLCVPSISCKIISISRLCIDNPILIQLYSCHFLIKDFKTNQILLH